MGPIANSIRNKIPPGQSNKGIVIKDIGPTSNNQSKDDVMLENAQNSNRPHVDRGSTSSNSNKQVDPILELMKYNSPMTSEEESALWDAAGAVWVHGNLL